MSKAELAQYLVNLNTLMAAQTAVSDGRSQFLLDEYTKHWALLKSSIAKENSNETRQG